MSRWAAVDAPLTPAQTQPGIDHAAAAFAARQLELISADLRAAARTQRLLLGSDHCAAVNGIQGLNIGVLWRPADSISGDVYRVERAGGFLYVAVADAPGHGIAAALMGVFIGQALEFTGGDGNALEPAEILIELNTRLRRSGCGAAAFATAAVLRVDLRAGAADGATALLATAGHPPLLRVRHDAPAEPIDSAGRILGVFDDPDCRQARFDLAAGDRLLLHTDGFEEAFAGNHVEALTDIFADPAPDPMRRLHATLDTQAGSLRPGDDLTLVALTIV